MLERSRRAGPGSAHRPRLSLLTRSADHADYWKRAGHRRDDDWRRSLCGAVQSAEQFVWRAGTAKGKITPQQPFWLAGFASRTKPAEGTLHELWVKALALEDAGQQRAIVITTDLVGYPKKVADTVCGQIAEQCGLRRSQIMLTCSHTHSAPCWAAPCPTSIPWTIGNGR